MVQDVGVPWHALHCPALIPISIAQSGKESCPCSQWSIFGWVRQQLLLCNRIRPKWLQKHKHRKLSLILFKTFFLLWWHFEQLSCAFTFATFEAGDLFPFSVLLQALESMQLKQEVEEERIQVLNNIEELEQKIKDLDNQMEESLREVQPDSYSVPDSTSTEPTSQWHFS